jgi:hypothetical protein
MIVDRIVVVNGAEQIPVAPINPLGVRSEYTAYLALGE